MNTTRLYQSKLTIEKSILSYMQRNSPSYPYHRHGRDLHHSVALQVSASYPVWKGSSTVTSNQWRDRQKRDRYVKYAQHHKICLVVVRVYLYFLFLNLHNNFDTYSNSTQ